MTTPYPIPRSPRQTDVLVGDGGKVYGPFDGFQIFDNEDVVVWSRASAADAFQKVDVTVAKVSGLSFDFFTIEFAENVPVATEFVVSSERIAERSAGVKKGTMLDMTALEKELSKIATVTQELRRDIDRAMKVQFNHPPAAVPGAQDNRVLGWHGGVLANIDPGEFINDAGFATADQGFKADSALQPNDNVAELLYSTTVPALPNVVRTAAAKLSDTISLLDFGGSGDGVADNSPAWGKAIAKLTSLPSGGRLYIPRGVYKFNTAIALAKVLGKAFEVYGDGDSTVLDISATPTGDKSISLGSADPNPPANTVFRNLCIRGGGATTNYAVEALNAHSLLFDHVTFEDMRAAVGATSSFAMRFSYCVWKRVGNTGFYANTACHDLVFDNPKAYGVGNDVPGCFLQMDVASDNVVIREPNFENCRQAVNMAGGGSLFLLEGGYVEYCTVPMIAFGAPMYGARISDTWLAESVEMVIANMIGGELKRVHLYNHKVSFGASSRDVSSADVKVAGFATFAPCAATTVTSFLAGASSDGTYPVRYSKRDGWVELGGLLNVVAMDSAAFVLPADYRPPIQKKFTTQSQSGNIGYVIVGANGNIVPNVPGQATAWLDGITFFCGR